MICAPTADSAQQQEDMLLQLAIEQSLLENAAPSGGRRDEVEGGIAAEGSQAPRYGRVVGGGSTVGYGRLQ